MLHLVVGTRREEESSAQALKRIESHDHRFCPQTCLPAPPGWVLSYPLLFFVFTVWRVLFSSSTPHRAESRLGQGI